jgi:hypothetical protein
MQCVNKFATYAVGISKAIYMHNTHLYMQICTWYNCLHKAQSKEITAFDSLAIMIGPSDCI